MVIIPIHKRAPQREFVASEIASCCWAILGAVEERQVSSRRIRFARREKTKSILFATVNFQREIGIEVQEDSLSY